MPLPLTEELFATLLTPFCGTISPGDKLTVSTLFDVCGHVDIVQFLGHHSGVALLAITDMLHSLSLI
jgi:hypothetical protein